MKKQNQILIVDDTEMNRALLADMLSADYEILEAANGAQAVAMLAQLNVEISLVLLDIVMPEMDGFEVLSIMKKNGWINDIPVITISAETSSASIDQAYDLGATDYISRPFDEKTVQRRVRNTIMLYSKQKMLEGMVAEQIMEKERNNFLMVGVLSNIVEFRNGESGLHVLHIRTITDILLRKLMELTDRYPLSPARMALIVNASALHDVGKISIPEEILNKPGRLTKEEFEVMKTHSAVGAQIMAEALRRNREELLELAYNICRWHHERYDGRGYPDGLEGEEIPIEAQVVALADVYDALTSERVYKKAFPHEVAMKMILGGECGVFNPVLMQCLEAVGPSLQEELKARSSEDISELNIRELSSRIIANGPVSNRTLTLLEQERVKYQFFASMSKEIQFEYSSQTDILTLSEWGANQLGLGVIIEHPQRNGKLREVFSSPDYRDFQRRLRGVTPEHPIVRGNYRLHVKGAERWYKAVARPLWSESGGVERVVGAIGKFVDVHEEQLQLDQLKRMAQQDSLTGLSNHPAARKRAEAALMQEGERRFALLLFDLDLFKEANERYGHLFGDQVLQHVARRVQKNVRDADIAARIGGDEFLVFIEYTGGDIKAVVRRLFDSLCGKYEQFPLSVSMGVAIFPQDGADYETLFRAADQALYKAKKEGRSQYCFYDDSMRDLLSVLSPMDH